jgi:hypothetical protein
MHIYLLPYMHIYHVYPIALRGGNTKRMGPHLLSLITSPFCRVKACEQVTDLRQRLLSMFSLLVLYSQHMSPSWSQILFVIPDI